MSGIIDTNILLYAVNQDSAEHKISRSFLENCLQESQQWYLTEGICYEFLRVATHPRVFPTPLTAFEATEFLEKLVRASNLVVLTAGKRHWQYLRQSLDEIHSPAGNLFFDIRTVVLMREYGVKTIYSADTDFLQFSKIEVINPLKNNPKRI